MPSRRLILTCLATTTIFLASLPARAGDATADGIEIRHPWARPSLPNRPGVAYLGIHNNGDLDDRLIGARAEGVDSIEMHLASQDATGVMKMAPVEAIEVPAKGMAHLGPGGYHLMLFGIAKPLKDGGILPLTLTFEQAGDVTLDVPVSAKSLDPHTGEGGQGHGQGHAHGESTGHGHGQTHGQGTNN